MKINRIIYVIIGVMTLVLLFACNEDKGNYDYVDIPEVIIENATEIEVITLDPADNVYIEPKITYLQGENNKDGKYSYRWEYFEGSKPILLFSSEESPVYDGALSPELSQSGEYSVYFTVLNVITGVEYTKTYMFVVKNRMQTGYIAISEKNEGFDLDIIASFVEDGVETLKPYVSLLSISGSSYPHKDGRKPIAISTFGDLLGMYPLLQPANYGLKYALYIMTDQSTDRLDPNDYSFDEEMLNLSKVSFIPPAYAPEKLVAEKFRVAPYTATASQMYAYVDGGWYFGSRVQQYLLFTYPINRRQGETKTFKASPYIAAYAGHALGAFLFNEEDNCFMRQSYSTMDLSSLDINKLWAAHKITDAEGDQFSFNNPNYDLVYMDTKSCATAKSDLFAVVKDRVSATYELLTFSVVMQGVQQGSKVKKIIPSTVDIPSIKHFVYNPQQPFIYMANEDKLFVGQAGGASKDLVVHDITSSVLPAGHKISTVKAVRTFKLTNSLRNLLIVASYNPNAELETSGTIQMFEMDPTSGRLTLAKHPETGSDQIDMKWDGFGKVIDIDYKEK